MIRGDASDWIDCFRGTATPQAERADALLGSELLIIGDLTLTEVLQGFGRHRDFDQARKLLTGWTLSISAVRTLQYRRRATSARCASVASRSARQ